MTDSDVKKPVVKAWGDKPVSVQNGGRVNAAFDKTNDGDVSPTTENKIQNNEKIVQRENVPKPAVDTEAKKKTDSEPVKAVGLFELFRFADKLDIFMMIIASLCSAGHGAGMPVLLVVFGDMTQKFVSFSPTTANASLSKDAIEKAQDSFMDDVSTSCIAFAGIGASVLFIAYGQVALWLMTSHRQTFKIRAALLRAVLRQEISWFDVNDSGGISSRLSDDVNKIQEGIGDKMGAFFQWISMFIVGIIIALVKGWKMSLVCLSLSPVTAVCGGFVMRLTTSSTSKELEAYSKAGAIATEVFSCIKTVLVFGGQDKECNRYSANLLAAKKKGIEKNMITGGGMGMTYFVIYCSYCLAFWYGGKLVREEEMNVGSMLTVFFCVLIASMALGNASPSVQVVGQARGAAYFVWNLIDRKPEIDSSSNNGACPTSLTGNIDFRDIKFHYPSRPDVPILNGLTLSVRSGQTVALVGGSGCGKSTVIQLLQRFYDPLEGTVFVDGTEINKLNIRWLRQHIGIVSQEPVLFAMSIGDNIRFGRDDVTQADIERAAEEANAHSFISELPEKYDTMVGERGAQLSGGQKQRIAIARALVRNPKILLLDEATSALDTESEAIVQSALDKARQGRTTIVIAHRLSTIRTADVIYGLKAGKVHEFGTHDELMSKEGIYYQLVTSQQRKTSDSEEDEDDENASDVEANANVSMSRGSLRRSRQSLREAAKSPTGVKISDEDEESDEGKVKDIGMMKLMQHNKPEWHFIFFGCVNSIIHGGIQPVIALLFGLVLGVFGPDYTDDQRAHKILIYSLLYVVLGFIAGLSYFLSLWFFGISGEELTMRLRLATFKALLRQDMSFFDNPTNGPGALATRLATDASSAQGATGVRLGMMLQAAATISVGVVIAFIYSWKFAFFVFGVMPFMLFGSMMNVRIAKGFSLKNKADLEEAGKVASEAIANVRTVASLNKEERFINDYIRLLEPSYRQNLKMSHVFGFAFSFTQAMTFFCDAAIFYFGAWLIVHDGLAFDAMFKVFGAVIVGALSLGRESQFAPDYGKAKMSAAQIFALLEKKPRIDNYSSEGLKPSQCRGKIELKSVEFSYPNRRTVKVMKGANLTVEPGQTFALVGQTGCGKSTTIQLLERLYDPSAGKVTLDGVDVRELNISWLRSQLGLVSQEPVLFDYSIRENIEYGDNSRKVTMEEVIAAARAANIHNFIESLPEGYDTRVGDKGTQLSGGQKQRIAIARALVRNPKILLLDEATSALDTESEKIVQEALDRAQHGRTCLVIAHRLSTIQNANRIVVFHQGRVAEQGTHTELMNFQQGLYYKLQHMNSK